MTDTPETKPSFDEYLQQLGDGEKSKEDLEIEELEKRHMSNISHMRRSRAVTRMTFEHAPYSTCTLFTHGFLEVHTHLPPEGVQHIAIVHTAGTVQIIGEQLEALALTVRTLQAAYIATGEQEGGGTVRQILVNGGQGNPFATS